MAAPRKCYDLAALRRAYLASGSLVAAARELGISDRTLNRHRKTDPELDRLLAETKAEFLANRQAATPHGSRTRYNRGCRCPECTAANTEAARVDRNRRAMRATRRPENVPHGVGGYRNHGCRCPICTEAVARAMALYRQTLAKREAS